MAIFATALTDRDSLPEDGCYPIEHDGIAPFRWTRPRFTLRPAHEACYLELELARPHVGGRLTLVDHQPPIDPIELIPGWQRCSIASLGVMLRSVTWHDDTARHLRIEGAMHNAVLNEQEYQAGSAVVRSIPPYLRITLEVRCNIANNEPCVYCAWKWMKNAEIGAPAADLSFVESLAPYLSYAKIVNDCSYGEPPLNRDFAEIVDLIATAERAFSFTSNGQTLQHKIRHALLGRNVHLYVSIDAATSAGYARYRDDGFDQVIDNVRDLCREKKSHGNLPHVTVSFIAMNSNKSELKDFIVLMQSVGVDRVKLMSLGRDGCMELDGRVKDRGNFKFNYDDEIIPIAQLGTIGEEAKRDARHMGLDLYLDWEDFPAHHGPAPDRPLCSEPWKSLYVLNRGIFPCCFGRKPLAQWSDQGSRPLGQFVDKTFNGPAFQEIRRTLASGEFPQYCRSSPTCPIVRHATADGARSASPPRTRAPVS
jgi:MoaA/NifB/PqqE/SkfB family radical SAM enzyme